MHTHSNTLLDAHQTIPDNLQRFADLGLDLFLTELDVRQRSFEGTEGSRTILTAQENALQKAVFKTVVTYGLQQEAVKAIQFWGITDNRSWIRWLSSDAHNPLLFDDNYNYKPAYEGVWEALTEFADPAS